MMKSHLIRTFKNIKPTGFLKRGWRLWAKALGEKQGNSREADKIAAMENDDYNSGDNNEHSNIN